MDSPPGSANQYAFLNHSTSTLPHDLPPNLDDRPLGRQKRKRTSPDDQAALEAAYKLDPKPDKAARLELVKRVALGEKEVQIWFQNRRQSSRRKSRPLLPHEIVQYQLARQGSFSQDPNMSFMSSECVGVEDESEVVDENAQLQLQLPGEDDGGKTGLATNVPSPATIETAPKHFVGNTSPAISSPGSVEHSAEVKLPASLSTNQSPALLQQAEQPVSISAAPLALPGPQQSMFSAPLTSALDSSKRLKKSRSFVRLSMSSDGRASITTKNGLSPSPPRPPPQMHLIDHSRTQQQSPHIIESGQSSPFVRHSALQRSSSGRSRDSRAWEFWCDKDSRTELETQAEKDSSGSAADAIGLLRSASGRSILGTIPSKRNSLLYGRPSDAKRSKLLDENRPRMKRSSTSLGRLQGGTHAHKSAKGVPGLKHAKSAVSTSIPGNDSDKENWSPEGDRPLAHPSALSRASGNAGNRRRSKSNLGSKTQDENADPEADPELAAFMRSGRQSNSMSSEEDMDCVHGLLSLSQGNWK
ncbi:Homeobox protein yox1 [Recurvomyces mirabilis]|nr:Homeobox protein yox1 [Recurvomyces mirabilis]